MNNVKKSILSALFSVITIGILTLLTYKTEYGVFLLASFGSSMVLLYGYPESPFAQPKNVFFGHLITHPPAGGNPIIVIVGSVSFDYLFSPVITGSIIIIISAIIVNKFILKKSYPSRK